MLLPAISELGGVIQLSGSLEDPVSGTVLKSSVVRVRRKADVLNGVDELIETIRRDLGEAKRSIDRQSKPLMQVTTSSLEALKVDPLARDTYRAARVDEGRALFEEALRIDPSFTSAKASLGMLNFELRDREKGQALLAQAVRAVDELTDKERYSVLAFHAMAVENDPQRAVDYFKALIATYPDSGTAYNNLGRAYMLQGQ